MRVAITGASGQLGTNLLKALTLTGDEVTPLNRPKYDITKSQVISQIADLSPEVVIHAAAWTDVDGCEQNPEAAYLVNSLGTQHVALACQACGAVMVYMSTDYVFNGRKQEPYWEFDEPDPINIYGQSKLAGEKYVRILLEKFYIVRTGWLFSSSSNNFVSKVLHLAEEKPQLHMVTNQAGSPTYALDLAVAIAKLIRYPLYGLYHLVNEGGCSRYELAKKILELAGRSDFPLYPCEEYLRPAKIPANAVLRNYCAAIQLNITLRPWQDALQAYFQEQGRQ